MHAAHSARSACRDFENLAGLVERVTFHNAETGFCVIRVKGRGRRDLITVVGHAATIQAGEWIQASGAWVNDRVHGLQFRAKFLRRLRPQLRDEVPSAGPNFPEETFVPGTHITDQQARLYMDLRRSHSRQIAAAKAGFSTSTGARLDADPGCPRKSRPGVAAVVPIRSLLSGRPRSCHYWRPAPDCGRLRFLPRCSAGTPASPVKSAARWSGGCALGRRCTGPSER